MMVVEQKIFCRLITVTDPYHHYRALNSPTTMVVEQIFCRLITVTDLYHHYRANIIPSL
jgi:hypothetical protein